MATPIEYLDHAADVGLRASGASLGEAFCEAARGMFEVMVDTAAVAPVGRHLVRCHGDTLGDLLVEWLGSLLVQKELTGMVFSRFEAAVREADSGFDLQGVAIGEPLDAARHAAKTEVKGISYLGLRVRRGGTGDRWVAECVLDV